MIWLRTKGRMWLREMRRILPPYTGPPSTIGSLWLATSCRKGQTSTLLEENWSQLPYTGRLGEGGRGRGREREREREVPVFTSLVNIALFPGPIPSYSIHDQSKIHSVFYMYVLIFIHVLAIWHVLNWLYKYHSLPLSPPQTRSPQYGSPPNALRSSTRDLGRRRNQLSSHCRSVWLQ